MSQLNNVLGLFCSDHRLNDGIYRLREIIKSYGGKLTELRQLGGAAAADDFSWLSGEIRKFLKHSGGGTFLATSQSDSPACVDFYREGITKLDKLTFLRRLQEQVIATAKSCYTNGNGRIHVVGALMHVRGQEIIKIEASPHTSPSWLTDFQNSYHSRRKQPLPLRRRNTRDLNGHALWT